MQLSQQYNQPNVSNEKVRNDQKNKTKKKLFGSDPIFQRLANSSDDEETEMNLNPPVNKKSKKMLHKKVVGGCLYSFFLFNAPEDFSGGDSKCYIWRYRQSVESSTRFSCSEFL